MLRWPGSSRRDTLDRDVLPKESGRSGPNGAPENSRSTGGAEAADGKDAGKKKQRSGAARRANTKRKKKDQTDEPEQDPAHQVAKARRKKKRKKHLMVGRSIHPAIPTGKRFLADPHGRRRTAYHPAPHLRCIASRSWLAPASMQEQQFPIGNGTTRGGGIRKKSWAGGPGWRGQGRGGAL